MNCKVAAASTGKEKMCRAVASGQDGGDLSRHMRDPALLAQRVCFRAVPYPTKGMLWEWVFSSLDPFGKIQVLGFEQICDRQKAKIIL